MRISWELKGQVLLESGRATARRWRRSARQTAMAPNAAPMKVLYGHALVSTDTPANTAEAIGVLPLSSSSAMILLQVASSRALVDRRQYHWADASP
jgi:hypothetical protein